MIRDAETKTWTRPRQLTFLGLLAIQFAVAWWIGTEELLTFDGTTPFPPIAVTAVVPVLLFFAAYALFPGFRDFVVAQDMKALTAIQLWRVVGFTMLGVYAFDGLPALFALPAGLGDVAVGLLAIVVLARVVRDPAFATSSAMVRFQWFGLADFAVAVGTATLAAGMFPALIPGGVTSGAMDVWPLNLFPSFGVPFFIIVHATALLKIRDLRRRAHAGYVAGLATA